MSGERVRNLISGSVQALFEPADGTEPATPLTFDPDLPGLLPADSPARIVHADPSMFVGGVRALLFQTLQPAAMYAVATHSDYRDDPLGRLQRTGAFLATTTYGSVEQGEQAIAVVRAIHSRVNGVMPDNTIYRADDPHLLGWVHATEVDSFLTAYQRFGEHRLTDDQADRYVSDMAVIGEALGVDDAPHSQAELAAMLDSYRPELRATPECRETTRFLFAPPLPLPTLPFYGVIFGAATAMLPYWARAMLLLPVAPGIDPLVLKPAARVITRTLRWASAVPSPDEQVE